MGSKVQNNATDGLILNNKNSLSQAASMEPLSSRRIDPQMEKAIINHLKKKLSRRVEHRLASIYEKDDNIKSKEEASQEVLSPVSPRAPVIYEKPALESHRDIFRRYNEYGDRVAYTPAIGKRAHRSRQRTLLQPILSKGSSRSSSLPGLKDPLPEIHPLLSATGMASNGEELNEDDPFEDDLDLQHTNGILINTSREGSKYSQRGNRSLSFQMEAEIISDEDPDLLELHNTESLEDIDAPISPVPTPHIVHRPSTREKTSTTMKDKHNKIFRGNMDVKCAEDTRIARLYISNAGIDTKWELQYLVTEVYPKLKEFCLQSNCELQIYDMHWAMEELPLDNHSYTSLCTQAIEECLSTKAVNFVALTSGNYGAYTLPLIIEAAEYELILQELEQDYQKLRTVIDSQMAEKKRLEDEKEPIEQTDEDKSKRKKAQAKKQQSIVQLTQFIKAKESEADQLRPQILTDWYKRDDNQHPAVYRLQRISNKIPDINKLDSKRRAVAIKLWEETSNKILAILQKYSKKLHPNDKTWAKYFKSLLEIEIESATKSQLFDASRMCWFKKQFDGINSSEELAAPFIETDEYRKIKMIEVNNKLKGIKQIPKSCQEVFGLDWIKEGFAPEQLRNHMLYLEKLAEKIKTLVSGSLRDLFDREKQETPFLQHEEELYVEVLQHVNYCQQRARNFQGRKDLLQKIKTYIRSDSGTPLVIHGKPGVGRKSLVCRAAKEVHKWCKKANPVLIFRSCGITSESQNIRQLLHSICMQLSVIFKSDVSLVPTGYRGLVNDFSERIKLATEEQNLIIVLDSLDQLSDEYDARKLSWMPKELPPNVKIIISCLPDERYHVLDSAKKFWGKQLEYFLEIGQLPIEDANIILTHWLLSANKNLSDDQYNAIINAYRECSTPLFLHCAFHEALSWTSFTPPENYKLAPAVKRVATVAFARLERDHGEVFVRRALGYITAARKGVTLTELEDLMSLDELVMDELSSLYNLKIRRCPPALLVRLKYDLRDYVMELSADALKTIQWSHTQFFEAAAERYLQQRDKAPSYHRAMAEYFTGKWSKNNKPTPTNEDGVPRFVSSQKFSYQKEAVKNQTVTVHTVYNKRALNELPFHFINSNQFDMLKSECLCNYEWLLAKLCGCGLRNIFDDFYLALSIEPKDKDLGLLLETFQLSRGVLEKDPKQLGSQLAGRLRSLIMKDIPIAPADPKTYPACHPLMAQISRSSIPTFYPSTTCLTPPGGALADILVGHKAEITAIAMTSEGMRAVSASLDNTMKVWDLRTGKVVNTITDVGQYVFQILVALDNKKIVTSEKTSVRIWDMQTGVCDHAISDFDDYVKIAVSQDSKVLICYVAGVNIMRSYNMEQNYSLLKEQKLEKEEAEPFIEKDKDLIISNSTVGDQILLAYRDSEKAVTQNIKTGAIIYTLKCVTEAARILAVAVSNEYFAVGYQFKYLRREMPYAIDIFATSGGTFVRTLRGCEEDNISNLLINSTGSHVLCASTSENTWSSDIAVWNMETEEHKHLASHPGVAHIASLVNLQYVVTTNKGESTLKLWNLSGSITKPGVKVKQSIGVANLVSMKDHPRYVVASATDNGPLTVWNIAKGKISGRAVRIEHGLVDATDIVVIRNTKAAIISDQGLRSNTTNYQSVYIYNLRSKRFERKVAGMYIIPARPHEFKLLSDDLLMGLSENRNLIYIWNLQTGSLQYRIKPSFSPRGDMATQSLNQEAFQQMKKRQHTAKMTPWDRRTESQNQKQKRQEAQLEEELKEIEEKRREKENGIEQFIMSEDEKVVVASFFSHHMCVFDMARKDHVQTLENPNSLLHLYVAALTYDGNFLVHTNYDEEEKMSYVTLWDCFEGTVRKRLKNEKDVCAIGISERADRILFGKGNCELRIWEPFVKGSLRKITGYNGMSFQFGLNKIFILKGGDRAIIYAGDISMWDLDKGIVLAVYTPDTRISAMTIAMGGQLLCFGLKDSMSVVSLRLIDSRKDKTMDVGENIFGENVESDSEEEEGD